MGALVDVNLRCYWSIGRWADYVYGLGFSRSNFENDIRVRVALRPENVRKDFACLFAVTHDVCVTQFRIVLDIFVVGISHKELKECQEINVLRFVFVSIGTVHTKWYTIAKAEVDNGLFALRTMFITDTLRTNIWDIWKAHSKPPYLTFCFAGNCLASNNNKYCDFNATLACSFMDDKYNLRCSKLKIHNFDLHKHIIY